MNNDTREKTTRYIENIICDEKIFNPWLENMMIETDSWFFQPKCSYFIIYYKEFHREIANRKSTPTIRFFPDYVLDCEKFISVHSNKNNKRQAYDIKIIIKVHIHELAGSPYFTPFHMNLIKKAFSGDTKKCDIDNIFANAIKTIDMSNKKYIEKLKNIRSTQKNFDDLSAKYASRILKIQIETSFFERFKDLFPLILKSLGFLFLDAGK